MKELETKKHGIEALIETLKSAPTIQENRESVQNLVEQSKAFLKAKNTAETRRFIDSYVDKVLVYKDTIQIFYKINVPVVEVADETSVAVVE